MGVLGDRVGRRRMLFIGGAVFALASLGAAYSPSPGALIAAPAAAHGRAERLDRQLLPGWLPRNQTVPAGRLDIVSAVTSLAAVLSAVYGLKRIAQTGLDPLAVAAVVLGVLAALFVRRQSRRDDPMVDLGLFRRTAFSVALASNTLSFFVLYGSQLWIAQYLRVVLGLSPLRAGIYTIPSVLGYLAGATIAPAAARRLSPHRAIGVGLTVVCTGFALMAGIAGGHGLALVIAGSGGLLGRPGHAMPSSRRRPPARPAAPSAARRRSAARCPRPAATP